MQPHIEAEYQDGYIHNEEKLGDISPFREGSNIFYDILNKMPEAEHGPMVRFTLFTDGKRYDIDWTQTPPGARPIRFKEMSREFHQTKGWLGEARINRIGFGYQYNLADGTNTEVVEHIDF